MARFFDDLLASFTIFVSNFTARFGLIVHILLILAVLALLGIAVVRTIMAGATVVMTSVCTGMGVGYPSLITSLARQVVLHLPAAYLLASRLGVQYTWYAWPISESISVIIAIVLVRRIYKAKMAEISAPVKEDA